MRQVESVDGWSDAIAAGIGALAGEAVRDEVAATWTDHAARERVEITLIGPYSSGKSSLLRRLLVDADREIPEWCTVSARRETFELNEVEVGPVTFTDAPGFASSNAQHEQLAEDAFALSDAFLLVVPPNLLTTRLPLAASLMSGEHFFGRPGGNMSDKVVAVIGQADTLGVDPEDDAEGMRNLGERKRTELVAQLSDAGAGDLSTLTVVVVSADPYEEQSRNQAPTREDFDGFREWDGIAELSAAIVSLANRRDELRVAAKARYFGRVAQAVAEQSGGVIEQSRATASELQARALELSSLRNRAAVIVDAAEADLVGRLISFGTEMAEEVSSADPEASDAVQAGVSDLIGRWATRHDAEVDLFLGEAGAQVDQRLERPAARHTASFLRRLAPGQTSSDDPDENSRVVRLLNKMQGDVEKVVRDSFELKMGQSIEKLLKDLEAHKHPGSARKTKAASTKGADQNAGSGAESSMSAMRAAQIANAGMQVAGGVLSIVTTIDAEVRQSRLDDDVRKAREAARDQLEASATALAAVVVRGSDGEPGWDARLESGIDLIRDALGVPEEPGAIDAVVSDVDRLTAELDAFRSLLDTCPQ